MSRKPRNPNWGQPMNLTQKYGSANVCAFDKLTEQLQLQPEQYAQSSALRAWVKTNRNRRYVPEWLLLAWGLEVDTHGVFSTRNGDL